MDEAKLINLFPKPLVLMENIFTDKLDFLESFLKQQKGFKRTATQNVDTTFYTDTKLFEKEEITSPRFVSFVLPLSKSDKETGGTHTRRKPGEIIEK